MNVSANKCKFAELKYEQLLSEKYFVETCFSKKFSSYNSKQQLADILFEISANPPENVSFTTIVDEIEC